MAEDDTSRVNWAATMFLAQVKGAHIREYAINRLKNHSFTASDSTLIELFDKNYQSGDEDLIVTALNSVALDNEQAHWTGMCALRVCESNKIPAVAGIAKWVYETNPCTICRRQAVHLLKETESLPPDIANEYQYDADGSFQDDTPS